MPKKVSEVLGAEKYFLVPAWSLARMIEDLVAGLQGSDGILECQRCVHYDGDPGEDGGGCCRKRPPVVICEDSGGTVSALPEVEAREVACGEFAVSTQAVLDEVVGGILHYKGVRRVVMVATEE